MSSPSPTNLPPEVYSLGDVQAEYRGDNLFLTGLGAAALCFVVGLVLLGLFLATGFYFPVLTILIPVGFIGSLFVAGKGLVEGRKTALVLKDGIAEVKRGKATAMRWDEITAVNQKITVSRSRRGTTGTPTYTYTVTGPKGTLSFSTYKGIQMLGQTIQNEVGQRLGPKMFDAYNRGETLQFGKVAVNKSGIDTGKGPMPWSEVEQLSLSAGRLSVRRNGQWMDTGQTAAQTPNLNVMMGIVNQVTNKDKAGQKPSHEVLQGLLQQAADDIDKKRS